MAWLGFHMSKHPSPRSSPPPTNHHQQHGGISIAGGGGRRRGTGISTPMLVAIFLACQFIWTVYTSQTVLGPYGYGEGMGDDERMSLVMGRGTTGVKEEERPRSHLPVKDLPSKNRHLDIGIPVSGRADALLHMVTLLGDAVQDFRQLPSSIYPDAAKVQIRLLITYNNNNNTDRDITVQRAKLQQLGHVNDVIFIPLPSTVESTFDKAKAYNAINDNACRRTLSSSSEGRIITTSLTDGSNTTTISSSKEGLQGDRHLMNDDCVLACVDVDMRIQSGFLVNSLTYAQFRMPYFPIVFSEYRPSLVQLLQFFQDESLSKQNNNVTLSTGMWRPFGFGNYAVHASDINATRADEGYRGWGKEDFALYKQAVAEDRAVIRVHDASISHIWHPKYCVIGSDVVDEAMQKICLGVRRTADGSSQAIQLWRLFQNNKREFKKKVETLFNNTSSAKEDLKKKLDTIIQLAESEYDPTIIAKEANVTVRTKQYPFI